MEIEKTDDEKIDQEDGQLVSRQFTRRAPVKNVDDMGYFIFCPLNGTNDRLTWKMCRARQSKGLCKNSKSSGVKRCQYFRKTLDFPEKEKLL